MTKIEININGTTYPCRPTMGSMLRFKRETGKEVTDIDGNSLSDLCTYLWCCVASACAADGIDFNMSLMDFADSVSSDEMETWAKSIQSESAPDGKEKKS